MEKQQPRPKVQRSCKRCDKTFFVSPSYVDRGAGVFCSLECFNLTRASKRPKVQRICKQCGVDFLITQSRADAGGGVHCSKKCLDKTRLLLTQSTCVACGSKFVARKQNRKGKADRQKFCSKKCDPHNRKPKVTIVCGWCGKVFASLESRKQKFCSHKCGCQSLKQAGKDSPRRTRLPEIHDWVCEVILRDKKCVRCGATEHLQAHHIKALEKHPELALDIDNGVAVCGVYHHFHHPELPLKLFLSGGKSVKRCLYCESPFVPKQKTQRACSRSCGVKIRRKKVVT